ncbi:MAG: hypothetical protein N3B10_07370 [Armatimonadetes bacterium]|nr:hypothetical protein [Armatimonadota bacterium]
MARSLLAEGKLHELEGKFDGAAQSYFDVMRLGLRVQGGLLPKNS